MAFYRIISRPVFRRLVASHITLDYCVISNEGVVYVLPKDVDYRTHGEYFSAWQRLFLRLYVEGKEPRYAERLKDDDMARKIAFQDYLLEI